MVVVIYTSTVICSVTKCIIAYYLTVLATFIKNWNVSSSSIILKSKETINNQQKPYIRTQSRYLLGLSDEAVLTEFNSSRKLQVFEGRYCVWLIFLASIILPQCLQLGWNLPASISMTYLCVLIGCTLPLKMKFYLVKSI